MVAAAATAAAVVVAATDGNEDYFDFHPREDRAIGAVLPVFYARNFPARPGTTISVGATPGASFIVDEERAPTPRALFHCGYRGFLVSLRPEMRGTLHLGGRAVPVANANA